MSNPNLFIRRHVRLGRRLEWVSLKFVRLVPKRFLSKDSELKKNLAKASMKSGYRVYVGLLTFTMFVTFLATSGFCYLFLYLLNVSIIDRIVFSLVVDRVIFSLFVGFIAGLVAFAIGYSVPSLEAYSRGSKIDSNLPHIAHFMAVLASSGMTPENVFRSLARVGKDYSVSDEVTEIIGEIELMGANLNSSLKRISSVSPSKRFGTMLNGVVSTSNMGGDLADYSNEQARKYKEEQVGKIKRFLDNLGVIAESYVAFMVAAPLMLIIMLTVMSYIGGAITLGALSPEDLLNLLTFVILPTGVAFLIFMVDSITPLR